MNKYKTATVTRIIPRRQVNITSEITGISLGWSSWQRSGKAPLRKMVKLGKELYHFCNFLQVKLFQNKMLLKIFNSLSFRDTYWNVYVRCRVNSPWRSLYHAVHICTHLKVSIMKIFPSESNKKPGLRTTRFHSGGHEAWGGSSPTSPGIIWGAL